MAYRSDFENVFADIIEAVYDTDCKYTEAFAEQYKDQESHLLVIDPEAFAKFCFNLYTDGYRNGAHYMFR